MVEVGVRTLGLRSTTSLGHNFSGEIPPGGGPGGTHLLPSPSGGGVSTIQRSHSGGGSVQVGLRTLGGACPTEAATPPQLSRGSCPTEEARSSSPAIRSLSATFIWHPIVKMWYVPRGGVGRGAYAFVSDPRGRGGVVTLTKAKMIPS